MHAYKNISHAYNMSPHREGGKVFLFAQGGRGLKMVLCT